MYDICVIVCSFLIHKMKHTICLRSKFGSRSENCETQRFRIWDQIPDQWWWKVVALIDQRGSRTNRLCNWPFMQFILRCRGLALQSTTFVCLLVVGPKMFIEIIIRFNLFVYISLLVKHFENGLILDRCCLKKMNQFHWNIFDKNSAHFNQTFLTTPHNQLKGSSLQAHTRNIFPTVAFHRQR